jgi:putative ABC transport system permease protein
MRQSPFYKRQTADQLAALGGRGVIDFRFGSLADAYLDPTLDEVSERHGDRKTILGLAAVALLILLLAATNYVNLATVRTLRRQREIGMRKVLGAGAPAVVRQFLAESVLVCLIATAIGLLLAWLLLPAFADLVQRRLDDLFTPGAIAAAVLLGIVLGLAAGAYPTWSALRVRPTAALAGRGSSETAGGLWLRRTLTVLQFSTAMGLTGLTLAVAWQTRYASQLDPGFDAAPLLLVQAPADMRSADVRSFRDALLRVPGVEGVAEADAAVTINQNSTSMRRAGGASVEISYLLVSPEFFQVYGLKPVAGRLYDPRQEKFEDEDKIVVNEAGALKLGFASAHEAVGQFVSYSNGHGKPMQVVGVAPNIRHRSAREATQATVYLLEPRVNVFTVRSAQRQEAVQRAIEDLWPRFFPNAVVDVKRVGALFALNYAEDLRLSKLLAASSVIAIAIAAFGIYVLSAYSVQRRTREIVLRKLYGASAGAIGRLVAREFATLIGIGALVGLPAAWLATARYLAGFTERAPVGLWTLSAALAIAALVALGSTLRHTLTAVRVTPVLALRD